MKVFLTILSLTYFFVNSFAQVQITGYVFESGNRGYIADATVTLSNENQTQFYGQVTTNPEGEYQFAVSGPGTYFLSVEKAPYFNYEEILVIDESNGKSVYLKHEIKRNPGYVFEITLAEKNPEPDTPKDALKGALVEVYNNTKKKEVLIIENLQDPNFKVDLLKGNHYTVLIRKPGFLSKRMEAFVDVKGCILCFEGIGRVTPGVADNLTEGNTMGVLLANVEMDRYYAGKVIGLNNIYYDFGKASLTPEAKDELNKVAEFLKDNPVIKVELGSHTDSRGGAAANLSLSERRAQSAVGHLIHEGGVSEERIAGKGYGEAQLANNCGDGVDCSEEEHQLNRRTELKVIDVITESGYRMLRQMKADELMEEILADLDNAGQIQVKEGESIEDAIQNQSGKTTILNEAPGANDNINQESAAAPAPALVVEEDKAKEENTSSIENEIIKEPVGSLSLDTNTKAQEEVVITQEVETPIENNPPPAPVAINEMQDQTIGETAVVTTADEEVEIIDVPEVVEEVQEVEEVLGSIDENELPKAAELPKVADLPNASDLPQAEEMPDVAVLKEEIIKKTSTDDDIVSSQSNEQKVIIEEPNEAQISTNATPNTTQTETDMAEWIRPGASVTFENPASINDGSDRFSPSYTGYKIVVIFSRYELPKEHLLFETYEKVDVYTTADGNKLYMLGSHPDRKSAEAYMNQSLRKEYPHAYVVGFENGIRIY